MCCWTGTGASIAANKVPGVRAALCGDAETADGARKWNDANVLALSLRTTSEALLSEILDAWFAGEPSSDEDDAANVRHVDEIELVSTKTCQEIRSGAVLPTPPRCGRDRIASCRPSVTLDSHIDKTTLSAKTCAVT